MNKYSNKSQTIQKQSAASNTISKNASVIVDNRPGAVAQRKLITNSNSPIQLGKDSKPFWVSNTGDKRGFIPLMRAQYDDAYRTSAHRNVVDSSEGQCPLSTFNQENSYARKYPLQGSKSRLGDAGIYAHKAYGNMKDFLGLHK